jgi:hypothetical protein
MKRDTKKSYKEESNFMNSLYDTEMHERWGTRVLYSRRIILIEYYMGISYILNAKVIVITTVVAKRKQ